MWYVIFICCLEYYQIRWVNFCLFLCFVCICIFNFSVSSYRPAEVGAFCVLLNFSFLQFVQNLVIQKWFVLSTLIQWQNTQKAVIFKCPSLQILFPSKTETKHIPIFVLLLCCLVELHTSDLRVELSAAVPPWFL